MLALVGQIPQQHIGRGFGFLHEIPDQLGVMRSLTKWAASIDTPQDAPDRVEEAFHQMQSGRPRPVGLECAVDVWPRAAAVRAGKKVTGDTTTVDQSAIEAAAALLGAAKQPLMVVGGGAQHASAEVKALAEWLQTPVAAGQMGFGVLDSRHPLSIPLPVAHKLWSKVDVVLAVGTRLHLQQMVWGLDADLKIIRIDIDAEEIARFAQPAVGIVGDSAQALGALFDAIRGKTPARRSPPGELGRARAAFETEVSELQPQLDYLQAIRAALPENGILVDEVTQLGSRGALRLSGLPAPHLHHAGLSGHAWLGLRRPRSASRSARPDCAVVSISGDGGFMFNVPELATAVRHGIARHRGCVRRRRLRQRPALQELRYGNRLIGCDLANPDFVELAKSFGMGGTRVTTPGQLSRPAPRSKSAT